MSYWSVYISREDEKALKNQINRVAKEKRWSFSQAVTGILREHLIDEKKRLTDDESWMMLSTRSFFEGYPEKDSIYDTL